MNNNNSLEKIEEFIQNTTIKMTLLVFAIMCIYTRNIHCSVIFVVMSFISYIRFYCLADVISIALSKIDKEFVQSVINYVLTCFVTVLFLVISRTNYGNLCFKCGIMGTISTTIVIMFYGLTKMFRAN